MLLVMLTGCTGGKQIKEEMIGKENSIAQKEQQRNALRDEQIGLDTEFGILYGEAYELVDEKEVSDAVNDMLPIVDAQIKNLDEQVALLNAIMKDSEKLIMFLENNNQALTKAGVDTKVT